MRKYNKRATVFELINAGKCNLNCTYCYIPKTSAMNAMHRDIEKYLASGDFIEDMEKTIGEELEAITLWGTEPTLTLDLFTAKMPELVDRFPHFKHVGFSSNFIQNTDSIVRLADVLPAGREFELKVQYSIDGPPYITDETRGMPGVTNKIINNVMKFFTDLNTLDLKDATVSTNCKITWDAPIIKLLASDLSRVREFYEFFNELNGNIRAVIENRDSADPLCPRYNFATDNIQANLGGCMSLGLPGSYTTEDGRNFAEVTKEIRRLYSTEREKFPNVYGGFNKYVLDLCKILDCRTEALNTPETFTCSAGDSEYGLDHKGQLHGCHRTFYVNDDRYVESVKEDNERQNWDKESFDTGKLESVRKNITVDCNDEYNKARFSYINGGFHYFRKQRANYIYGMVRLMALAGQASKAYLNESVAQMFSHFMLKAMCCPIADYVDHHNYRATALGLTRIFGNGAFEDMLDEVGEFKASYECDLLQKRNEELKEMS